MITEYNAGTGGVLADYVYSGSKMIVKEQSGTRRYYLSDPLSERLLLDASANVVGRQAHLPYGEAIGGVGEQEQHLFTSYERDS